MNSRERVAAAMRLEVPDRVPVMCQLALGHYFLNVGIAPHKIWFTSDGFARAILELRARYGFDGVLINMPGRDPDWRRDVEAIGKTSDGEVIRWRDGGRTVVPRDDNALYSPPEGSPGRPTFGEFDPDRDFDRLDDWPLYTWGVYHVPHIAGKAPGLLVDPPKHFTGTIDRVVAAAHGEFSVHGEIFSPFTHFLELFGYQDALLALLTDPTKSARILEGFADASIAWGRVQATSGVDAMLISSAFAGGGFISLDMYREFVIPCERRVTDALHAEFPELPIYTHTCGRLGDRLELLVETGTNGVDTLDPPPLGNTRLEDAKRRIGDRLFIKGNINAAAFLCDDERSARERALRTLREGMPGGGYILSTACSVSPHVEPEKLEMSSELAERFGRYA